MSTETYTLIKLYLIAVVIHGVLFQKAIKSTYQPTRDITLKAALGLALRDSSHIVLLAVFWPVTWGVILFNEYRPKRR